MVPFIVDSEASAVIFALAVSVIYTLGIEIVMNTLSISLDDKRGNNTSRSLVNGYRLFRADV